MTGFKNVTLPCKIEGRFLVAGPWFGSVKVSILKQGICISVWAWQELHELPIAMASSFNDPCWQIWWVWRKEKESLSLSIFLVSKTCCHVLRHAFFLEMNVVFINILFFCLVLFWWYAPTYCMVARHGLTYNNTLKPAVLKTL